MLLQIPKTDSNLHLCQSVYIFISISVADTDFERDQSKMFNFLCARQVQGKENVQLLKVSPSQPLEYEEKNSFNPEQPINTSLIFEKKIPQKCNINTHKKEREHHLWKLPELVKTTSKQNNYFKVLQTF